MTFSRRMTKFSTPKKKPDSSNSLKKFNTATKNYIHIEEKESGDALDENSVSQDGISIRTILKSRSSNKQIRQIQSDVSQSVVSKSEHEWMASVEKKEVRMHNALKN